MTKRIQVAVLGATGAVGQTFVRLLAGHPWFELVEVAASERSAGKRYEDVARWLEGDMPEQIASLNVLPCDPSLVKSPVVFSALDSSVAGEVELAFASAGAVVLSNAKNYRLVDDVPLVIPEVNGSHLAVLDAQRRKRGWTTGGIVTNANCAATVIALALAPLHERFRLKQLFVTTMQAVSGAGYPGVASLDILGNLIPYIADEEPKIELELRKLLGESTDDTITPADFAVSVHANRVAVEHGHTACISASFEERVTPELALEAFSEWVGDERVAELPSAPQHPIVVFTENDRPQPRRDVELGGGMSVSVGRVRGDPVLDLRLVAMGHNVVRGAAGGSVLNAELLATMQALPLE